MIKARSLGMFLVLTCLGSCSAADSPGGSPDSGGVPGPGSGGVSGGGSGGSGGNGTTLGGGGGASGSGGTWVPTASNQSLLGTGGNVSVTPDAGDTGSRDASGAEKPARMCLAALGDAPGGYDWTTCCPNEAATAQDWCTHYMSFCKFNYPINSNLSPGAVALKDMADCLARFPPLTLKSRACRSNFLCEDSNLGQATAKACDFPDLNRRKCDGL